MVLRIFSLSTWFREYVYIPLGGFLADSYETVVLAYLRYYRQPLSELMAAEEFGRVLICYSIGNFLTDTNLVWLL